MAEPKFAVGDLVRWEELVHHENGMLERVSHFGCIESIVPHFYSANGYSHTAYWYYVESDMHGLAAVYKGENSLSLSTLLDELAMVSS